MKKRFLPVCQIRWAFEKNGTCLSPWRVGVGLRLKSSFMPTLWSVSHKPCVCSLLRDLLTLTRWWDGESSLSYRKCSSSPFVSYSAVCLPHPPALPSYLSHSAVSVSFPPQHWPCLSPTHPCWRFCLRLFLNVRSSKVSLASYFRNALRE